jgi:hypothetical protein
MEPRSEKTVVHGLRLRETGEMVRVRRQVVVLQDEPYYNEDVTFHMTLDPEHPVFDAGSPEVVALSLLSRSGASERYPNPAAIAGLDVEPVAVETVVTRKLSRLDVAFEREIDIKGSHVIDLSARMAKVVPELQPFIDALAEHQAELSAGFDPGTDYERAPARLVVLVVPKASHELAETPGLLVSQGSGNQRRAVGVLDLPENLAHWLARPPRESEPVVGSLLVCLDDKRPVSEAFLDQVSGRGMAPSP